MFPREIPSLFPLFLALCVGKTQPPSARTPSLVCWICARTRPEGVMPRELVRALESDSRGLPLDVQAKRRIEGKNSRRSGREKERCVARFRLSFPVESAGPREACARKTSCCLLLEVVCPREVQASRGFRRTPRGGDLARPAPREAFPWTPRGGDRARPTPREASHGLPVEIVASCFTTRHAE